MQNKLNYFLEAVQGNYQGKPPIWLMRQAGRYMSEYQAIRSKEKDFLKLCYTPELAAKITFQPIRHFDFDAAILFSDILVIPDALGKKVTFVEGEGPKLDLLKTGRDIAQLKLFGMVDRLAPVYEAMQIVRKNLPSEKAALGFAGSPWTLATYMVAGGGHKGQLDHLYKWVYGWSTDFTYLLDLLVEAVADHLVQQIRAGADAVQIFESWGSLIPGACVGPFCITPLTDLVQKIREAHPKTPISIFAKGLQGQDLVKLVQKAKPDVISVDTSLRSEWVRDNLQPLCVVQGNLDSYLLVEGGDSMAKQVHHILDVLAPQPMIFNLGHGVLKNTPVEHVEELVKIVRNWKIT